jgi:SEC-C motif-containing protein
MKCPCGLNKNYTDCCGAFISGASIPSSPEELMRSRYTAYTQANIDYIVATMKSPAADRFDATTARAWAQQAKWEKLEVISTSAQPPRGFVEFIAYYEENRKRYTLHEASEFHLIDGRWFYIDGKTPAPQPVARTHQPGRNDPCHCGSGKKFKKCCGN